MAKKIDQLFVQWDKTDSPGCALAVIKDGETIYKRGYGIANLDYGVPISSQSVVNIGSMYSGEIEATYLVVLKDDKLVLRRKNVDGDTPLIVQFADAFSGAGTGSLRFTRDGNRRISGFLLSTGRVRNLRFDKR